MNIRELARRVPEGALAAFTALLLVGPACGTRPSTDTTAASSSGLEGEAQEATVIRSCQADASRPVVEAELPAPAPGEQAAPSLNQEVVDRSLIRTVDLMVAADDTDAAAARIEEIAAELGGYGGATDAQRRDELSYYSITVHVPAPELEAALARIKALASIVDRENLRTEDVTDQVIDLDARLRTLTATEAELQALLAESRERGDGLEDIMAVYGELTELRSQIERAQARLDNLQKRVAFSTVNIELRPTEAARPVTSRWRPAESVRASVRALVETLQALVDFVIYFAIVWFPIGCIVAIPIWATMRLWSRARAARS